MKVLAVDMDGVVADFDRAFWALPEELRFYEEDEKKVPPYFFKTLAPIDNAIESIKTLSVLYEVHFLSTPQWSNPASWGEKREWIHDHFGDLMHKRLTLTHHKGKFIADYLIDDRICNGVEFFTGEHIHFGSEKFPTWGEVTKYLIERHDSI